MTDVLVGTVLVEVVLGLNKHHTLAFGLRSCVKVGVSFNEEGYQKHITTIWVSAV